MSIPFREGLTEVIPHPKGDKHQQVCLYLSSLSFPPTLHPTHTHTHILSSSSLSLAPCRGLEVKRGQQLFPNVTSQDCRDRAGSRLQLLVQLIYALRHLGFTFLPLSPYSFFLGQRRRVRIPNFLPILFHSFLSFHGQKGCRRK